MKLKNGEIVRIFNRIGEVKKKRLPVRLGFAINRNVSSLENFAMDYDKVRKEILTKYCVKDENGNPVIEGDEYALSDRKSYGEEMTELLHIENEVQMHTVSFEEIEKCDLEKFDSLTPEELDLLTFMIEE